MKVGKAPGMDGITAKLQYRGDIVIDWMVWICNLAYEQSKVPEAWRKAITVPLYKGKGNREECNNYRCKSLLSVPGTIYGRILNMRMMKTPDKSVSDEQGGFLKGMGCVDQIFAWKILVKSTLRRIGRCLLLLWTWRRLMIELKKLTNPARSYLGWEGGLHGDLPGGTLGFGIIGLATQSAPQRMLPLTD